MHRINQFLIVTVISLVSLIAVVVAGYVVLTTQTATSANPSNWMGQMWGGMMGSGYTGSQATVQNAAAPWLGTALIVLIGVAVVGIAGLVYFFAFPEIRNMNHIGAPSVTLAAPTTTADVTMQEKVPETPAESAYVSVAKTLTADERKVVDVLKSHSGKYLQKYIRSETQLSRLQTHRIVARLAERGVVSLEKTGNTNTVMLAEWLK